MERKTLPVPRRAPPLQHRSDRECRRPTWKQDGGWKGIHVPGQMQLVSLSEEVSMETQPLSEDYHRTAQEAAESYRKNNSPLAPFPLSS